MEYLYYPLPYEDEILHLIKVDPDFVGIANGNLYHTYIQSKKGPGKICVIVRDANGIYTLVSEFMPLRLTDDYLADLDWQHEEWN